MTEGKILLTGSAGFVGVALAPRLGDRMLVCDSRTGRSISDVVNSPDMVGVDTVIHCAATQLFTPGLDLYSYDTFHQGNVCVLQELLDACVRNGVRKFIHISTDMVYGVPKGAPFRETDELDPVGHYGRSKREAERLVRAADGPIPVVTIFRPRVIGGPGRGGLFITLTKLAKKHLPVPLFGPGNNLYQMIHVQDFADLIMEAVERDVPGTFNAGCTHISTMRDKVRAAGKVLGVHPFIVSVSESFAVKVCSWAYRRKLGPLHPEQYLTAGRDFTLSMDNTLAHFQWRPKYGDDEIIADAVKSLA